MIDIFTTAADESYFEYQERYEANEAAMAIAACVPRIQSMIADFGIDRATAIRWDMDANDAYNGDVLDASFYCYLLHIPYSFADEIKELVPGSVNS